MQKKKLPKVEETQSNICSIIWTVILALLCGLMRSSFIYPWSLLLACTALFSCNKDNGPVLFELNHQVDFTIQPGLNTLDTHVYTISPLKSILNDHLTASGRTIDEVSSIKPQRAVLASIFQDVNLDFIDRVSIIIYDPFNPTDKIEFFYLDPVPFKNKTSIELFPGIADVSEWMKREYFGVEIRLNYRQVTPSLIQMRLDFDLSVFGK